MADDAEIDLSEFPTDVDVPSTLTAEHSSAGEDAAVQMIPFPFCLLFAGRPWMTLTVAAPSPEDAASTMDQFVRQVLNPQLVRMRYPPNVCSWNAGACG
jgi:hypothetical protein